LKFYAALVLLFAVEPKISENDHFVVNNTVVLSSCTAFHVPYVFQKQVRKQLSKSKNCD